MDNRNQKIFSLFSGAGGLDIGLEQAGFETVLATDIEAYACETLRQNKRLSQLKPTEYEAWFDATVRAQRCYSSKDQYAIELLRERLKIRNGIKYLKNAYILQGDIREFPSESLASLAGVKKDELTLIAGGPPCQPFSRSGKRETVEVADGRLFQEFVRIVNDLRPRWFLFENVKGLAQSRTQVKSIYCSNCKKTKPVPFDLRNSDIEIGSLHCNVCGSNKLEINEKEIRGGSLDIIINEFERVGYKCYHKLMNSADYGVPQSRERLFIVGSRDGEAFSWPLKTHANNAKEEQRAFLFGELLPWVTVEDVLWQSGHPQFGQLDYSKALLWVKNVVRPHDEPVMAVITSVAHNRSPPRG